MPTPIDPKYYRRKLDPKSEAYSEAKEAAERIIVAIPSTTDIPQDVTIPLGAQRFAAMAKRAGCDIVWTYAKAVQPPTRVEKTGEIKPPYVIDSIAVHFRRIVDGHPMQGAAVWETRIHATHRQTTNTLAGWRTRGQQHLPGVKGTEDYLKGLSP